MKKRTSHSNEHLSSEAQAIAEKVVGNNGTTVIGNLDFFARRAGIPRETVSRAIRELVQAKILFRSGGFYTNRPPRTPTPHQQALANLHPALDAGN